RLRPGDGSRPSGRAGDPRAHSRGVSRSRHRGRGVRRRERRQPPCLGDRPDRRHRSFISGVPLWGTLVGLTEDGDAVAGMMSQPFTGELFFADADGARYEGPGGACALSVRPTRTLAEATLCTTTPALFIDG